MIGHVYLIHFERPISPRSTTQHYCGWALDLAVRLAAHRAGRGARLTQVAIERGIAFDVVATWPGDRYLERYLKSRKELPRLCPVCGVCHRRGPLCLDWQQLALDLEVDPFDIPAPRRMAVDWYEMSYFRRPVQPFYAGTDGGDIPW